MPYLKTAKVEHTKLTAKIDVLELVLTRLDNNDTFGYNAEAKRRITSLLENLQHMKQVLERRARL